MITKNDIFVSLEVYNAYKSNSDASKIRLNLIKIESPFSGNFDAWVTQKEADYYFQIIEEGKEFWTKEHDSLNFSYVDKNSFNQWRLSF